MIEHWRELTVGLGLAIAGAAGGVYATSVANSTAIERIEEDVSYLRHRVDDIYDRLPARGGT